MDKPNNTPPPWSEAPPAAQWMAQDKSGAWFFYRERPIADDERRVWGEWRSGCLLVKWGKPNPNWKTTLQKRPENE